MPLYMDRHDGENLTPEAVAEAHAKDLKIQDKYDVKFITYWYDDDRDSVFCLVQAPDMSTVHKVHNEAHGFHHNEIMEVDQNIVKAFLGRVEDPAPVAGEVPIDSPFRAIMFTDLEGSTRMISELGDERSMELLRVHNALTRDALHAHSGREVKHTGDGFMASFTSDSPCSTFPSAGTLPPGRTSTRLPSSNSRIGIVSMTPSCRTSSAVSGMSLASSLSAPDA